MRQKSYYFIGGVAPTDKRHGGETIKNTLFIQYLEKKRFNVQVIDTAKGKKNLPFFLVQIMLSLLLPNKKSIILSAATHSAYRYIKLAKYFNVFNKEILYFVIGGTITERIEKREINHRDLHFVNSIYIESKAMKRYLNEKGLNNVHYMPNFKPIQDKIIRKNHEQDQKEFKLLFISRIKIEKGVNILLEVFKALKKEGFLLSLDFYGPIENTFEKEFLAQMKAVDGVAYKGFIDLMNDENAYQELSEYDINIFPTYHYGEGFPGIFIDCFTSGVPVIATDWKFNSEILEDGKTGYLTQVKDLEDTQSKIRYLLENPEVLNEMKKSCNQKALEFDIDFLLQPIFKKNV